ncbi:MAG TPA: hypothetical protein VL486_01315 [Verrucomicrobiae bacterium]|nr:hypothetical protein [Verrucomicrobiae bacterium]
MNLLLAAVAALVLALAGCGMLRCVWPGVCEQPRYARLALGYCVGCGIVTAIFFVTYLVGFAFSRAVIVVPVLGLAVFGAFVGLRSGEDHLWKDAAASPASSVAWGLLILLAFVLSWSRPIYGYDALSMWGLKAKVAFFARTWPPALFDPHTTHHPGYPPLIPSAQAFVFFVLGEFDDVASRVIFAAFYAAGAGILWWLLERLRVSARGVWLLWWCALPLMMEQVKITYADLPLAVLLMAFYGAVVLWLREPRRSDWLWLASVFAGIAFWVKEDALIGVGSGCIALVLVAFKRRFPSGRAWRMILVSALISAPWELLVWWKRLPSDFDLPTSDIGSRSLVILRGLLNAAFLDGGYAFFWPVFVVVLVFCGRRLARTENLWLTLSTVFGVGGTMFVYLGTRLDLAAQLKTSADRVLLGAFVPSLLLVALLWRASFRELRSRRWNVGVAVATFVVALGMFWSGLHRKSDEQIMGFTISPFPLALSWVWLVTAGINLVKFVPRVRRHRPTLVWRATQFAVVVATFGLAAVSVGVRAQEAGELRRQFGGKTLAQQHALTVDPRVRERLELAMREWPAGTHVRVRPKRSLLYHQFYYESFPSLVVDDSAEHEVSFSSSP